MCSEAYVWGFRIVEEVFNGIGLGVQEGGGPLVDTIASA